MSWVLPLLIKYWRLAGGGLLLACFLVVVWLALERGRERDRIESELALAQKKYNAHIRLLEQSRQDREESDEFREKQNTKLREAENSPLALDDGLRAVYDSLRERQRSGPAR